MTYAELAFVKTELSRYKILRWLAHSYKEQSDRMRDDLIDAGTPSGCGFEAKNIQNPVGMDSIFNEILSEQQGLDERAKAYNQLADAVLNFIDGCFSGFVHELLISRYIDGVSLEALAERHLYSISGITHCIDRALLRVPGDKVRAFGLLV